MAFHDVSFPMTLALGAKGGPEWRTDVVQLASGWDVRNSEWSRGKRRWEVGSAITDLADLQSLMGFFEARSGPVHGFRFRDPLDHSSAAPGVPISCNDQLLGYGDGATTEFALTKTVSGFARKIRKPAPGTVQVGVDGTAIESGWSVDTLTGLITFDTAPAANSAITAGFLFDQPVRFETEHLEAAIEVFGAGRVLSVSLIEIWEETA